MRTIRNATFTTTGAQSDVISEMKTQGKRLVLEINNNEAVGGDDAFVSVDSEAAASKGRRIQPGQTIVWSADGGYIPPQGQVTCYSAAAITLSIYEEIEV